MIKRDRRLRMLAVTMSMAALLATACGPVHEAAAGDAAVSGTAQPSYVSPSPSSTGVCGSGVTCYTPQQLQVAYGVKPLLDRGIDGRGETVVLPELAESQLNPPLVTDLRQDMAAFDGLFHLPAARMRVVTTLAGSGSPWLAFGEEVLDAEVVHALAPDAKLVILLLPSTSLDNTPNAVAAALAELRRGPALGGVMSISAAGQIGGEHCVSRAQAGQLNTALQAAVNRGLTVVTASGDIGAAAYQCDLYSALTGTPPVHPAKGVLLLASDPFVLSAGGTALTASQARRLDQRNGVGPGVRKPRKRGRVLPGLRGRVQRAVRPALLPGRRARHRRYPTGSRCVRRCQRPHGRGRRLQQRNPGHGPEPRRD